MESQQERSERHARPVSEGTSLVALMIVVALAAAWFVASAMPYVQ